MLALAVIEAQPWVFVEDTPGVCRNSVEPGWMSIESVETFSRKFRLQEVEFPFPVSLKNEMLAIATEGPVFVTMRVVCQPAPSETCGMITCWADAVIRARNNNRGVPNDFITVPYAYRSRRFEW
jgi:hypothetical protein